VVDTLLAVEASNVGPAVCAQHELQSRLGEEGKPRDIVGETEEFPAIEELAREMRVDEETAPAVDEGEPNRAADGSAVPGVPSGHGRRPRAHRSGRSTCSRSWEDDIDRVASLLQCAAEAEDDPPACATGAYSEATILPRTRFSPYRPVETGALLEADGYATLYGKHGLRTIRVGRRTWEVLQQLAVGKELDDRIVAITDERIQHGRRRVAERSSSCPTGFVTRTGSHAHQRGAPAATIRDTLGHASLSTTDLYLSSSPTDGSSLYSRL
jgi:hypothetical protein